MSLTEFMGELAEESLKESANEVQETVESEISPEA